MFSAPWICSRCVSRTLKVSRKQQLRFQTSGAFKTTPSQRVQDASSLQPTADGDGGISNVLLNRARSVAAEHSKLSARLAQNFDAKIAKKIGELSPVTQALKELEDAHESISELQSLVLDPSIDNELHSLATDDLAVAAATLPPLAKTLKATLIPPHPFAHLPCLLEIRPGAGGSEAALFATELLRMYTSFCAQRGLRASLVKYEFEEGPTEDQLTDAVMEIETQGAYDILRTETGVHRVQRVPATESKGRVHTSAVSVLVLPSFPTSGGGAEGDMNDPNSDHYINPSDVRSETMRARGAGGQHVNTTDSAVRLTHIPTSTVVAMQDSRSQHKNREKAWQLLRAKLAQARREKREEEMVTLRRRSMGGLARMGRESKVRTYNWGQNRVTDHRVGVESRSLGDVLAGGQGLEGIMERVRGWLVDVEVAALVAEEEEEEREGRKKGDGGGGGNGKKKNGNGKKG